MAEIKTLEVFATALRWAEDANGIAWQDWYDADDAAPMDWPEGGGPDEVVHVVRLTDAQAALDALAEAHQAEVEDWRGRLAAQCGETLAAQAEVARLTRENEGLAKALGEIAWSNDSKWQSDRANAALAGASGAQEGERT